MASPDQASSLSAAGLEGLNDKGARVVLKDGKASLLTWNDAAGKWGRSPSGADIPVFDKPAVGRAPLELWKPSDDVPGYDAYRGMHAGNPITEMSEPSAEVAKAPSADQLIASDPELKALAESTAQYAAEHGVAEEQAEVAKDPNALVKALHAAATCLINAAEEVMG